MSQAIRVSVNPSDTDQRYVMWDTGRIDAHGGAPTPVGSRAYGPNTVGIYPGMQLQITDWLTPGGYTAGSYGGIYEFGSASPGATPIVPTLSTTTRRDMMMNPAGDGLGYILDGYGAILANGGHQDLETSLVHGSVIARRAYVEWSTKKWYILRGIGTIYAGGGAPAITGQLFHSDIARAFVPLDFTSGKGWVLDGHGTVTPVGGAEEARGGPHWTTDVARDLALISDGQDGRPLTFVILHSSGVLYEWTASDPPTVAIDNVTITDTTRPELTWVYDQAQGDAQASYTVRLYLSAAYDDSGNRIPNGGRVPPRIRNPGGALVNPPGATASWDGDSAIVRGVQVPQDLRNGTYNGYIKLTSTAGLVTAGGAWTGFVVDIDVTPPTAPTLAATLRPDGDVQLIVTDSGTTTGQLFRVEYAAGSVASTDDDGTTTTVWSPVSGAVDLPADSGTVTVVDRELPAYATRSYRAFMYTTTPYLASNPSAAVVITSAGDDTPAATAWKLTVPSDSTLGGSVVVAEGVKWSRPTVSGTFQPSGRTNPIVVSDGTPKGMTASIQFYGLDRTACLALEAVIGSGEVLLLRDPHGHAWYCKVTGGIEQALVPDRPQPGEDYPTRYAYLYTVPLTQVDRPT